VVLAAKVRFAEAAKGRKLASKDEVDSNTIRGCQALPLVHFLFPRLQVAVSLAPARMNPTESGREYVAALVQTIFTECIRQRSENSSFGI
jgi:hypothetical protein